MTSYQTKNRRKIFQFSEDNDSNIYHKHLSNITESKSVIDVWLSTLLHFTNKDYTVSGSALSPPGTGWVIAIEIL